MTEEKNELNTPEEKTSSEENMDSANTETKKNQNQEIESQDSLQQNPTVFLESEEKKKPIVNKKALLIILAVLIVGGIVIGGISISRKSSKAEDEFQSAATQELTDTSMEESIEEATGTAEEEIDLVSFQIQVLNGSGVAGEAGRVQGMLETEGFSNFKVGNAENYDYADTEINLKEGTPKVVYDKIASALNSDYQPVQGDTLTEDSDYDVVVIVGIKK